jgi:hypothetical protein
VIERVADAVARELGRFGATPGMAPLVDVWADAVGPQIARHAWPARLGRDGSLRVHTSDSVWAFELQARAEEICGRLGGLAPARLVFVPGPIPTPSPDDDETSMRAAVEPSAKHRASAASLVRGIRDEELREIVAKTVALSLAAGESGRPFW